ncbi:S-layer homology domain-containing protein [Thermophilibacter sp. ET337]|uniref:S-layer homology domain-containing protein n=1 Tax=Thermophilibacter sp. ET337 TaxID=2973084 RepID=UPI0021AD0FC9|nr:S-layer homology domain-containing protein [Thermophilibacter sp. ET337]MCR8907563.1 S-layer homology domain-containing protein [Thermophilibacter sp. ET337]
MFKLEIKNGARVAAAAGLGLALTFGAVPVVALAEGGIDSSVVLAEENAGAVAQIGDVTYSSLSEAFKAACNAESEQTIELLSDCTISDRLVIESEWPITLELNGHTVNVTGTGDEAPAIRVKASLVIQDTSAEGSGSIVGKNCSSNGVIQLLASRSARLTLKSGSIISDGSYGLTLNTLSAFTMEGGTVSARTCIRLQYMCSATILDGSLVPTGGDGRAVYLESGAPTLVVGSEGGLSQPSIEGTIEINSGLNLSGENIKFLNGTIEGVTGKLPEGAVLECAFSKNISSALPDGLYCVEQGGSWVVTSTPPEGAVASFGGRVFDSLKAAIDKARESDGTVTLLVNTTENVVIPEGADITLNLGGCQLSEAPGLQNGAGVITIESGATAVIEGPGVVDATQNGTAALVNSGTLTVNGGTFTRSAEGSGNTYYTVDNQGTMTFNGGSVQNTSKTSSLVRNGGYGKAELTVTGGTFQNDGIAIKNDECGVLEVSGGTITSTFSQSVQNWGGATLSGGEYLGGPVSTWSQSEDSTGGGNAVTGSTTITGSAVIYKNVETYNLNSGQAPTVKIEGGTVKGSIQKYTSESSDEGVVNRPVDANDKSSSVSISGGSFASEVPDALIDSESTIVKNPDGFFTVVGNQSVAIVDGVAYDSLDTAVRSAQNGQTIQLVADVKGSITVPSDKSITLDLYGKKLTNAEGSHTITVDKGGSLTVTDSSNEGSGTVDCVTNGKGALVNYGTVVVKGGEFTRSAEAGTSPSESGFNSWYVIDNQGAMTFEGGKVVNHSKFSSLVRNIEGTLTINDGTFENDFIALKNDDGGTLVVNGGAVSSDDQAIQNWSDATIAGGTLTGDVIAWDYGEGGKSVTAITDGKINGDVKAVNYKKAVTGPKVSITGGSISGEVSKGTYGEDSVIEPVAPDDATSTIVVSGGSFGEVVDDALLADGFEQVKNPDGTYGVRQESPSVPSIPSEPTYDVEVPEAEGGKVAVSDASPEEGDKVTVTATPDEGQEVREVVVTDAEGNEIEVTPGEDGTYTFEMPKGDVTVEVTFGCDGGELCPTHSYADLDQAEWYHDAVDWAVTSGAILGYGDGTFGPGNALTRAEMATILCRLAGEPEADLEGLPSDVPATEWYANGVAWALAEGVFNGNGDGSFDPAGAITREQAACVLYNRAQAAGEDVSARADLSGFADADELSGWAEEAMSWAVAEGVFSGGAAGLEPGRALTRSEGAAILWNWETRE